jgi:hypothetical protein
MMLLMESPPPPGETAAYFFGHFTTLAEVITQGRLDYYLSLPKPVLLHVLASRSIGSGMGDIIYGIGSFIISGYLTRMVFAVRACRVHGRVHFYFVPHHHPKPVVLAGEHGGVESDRIERGVDILAVSQRVVQYLHQIRIADHYPCRADRDGPCRVRTGIYMAEPVANLRRGACLSPFGSDHFHSGLRRYESGSAIQVEV